MKKNKFKTAIVIGMLSFLFTLSASAQQRGNDRKEPPTYAQLLKEMDANEDGQLTKEEVKGRLKENFTEIDADEDGFISEEEFKNAPKPARKKRN